MKTIFALALTTIILLLNTLSAQDRMLTHLSLVPQSNQNNPASTIPYKYYFGMPMASSIYFTFQNPFAYNDIIKTRSDDSLYIDQKGFVSSLGKNTNLMFIENRIDMFNFGFRIKKNFFTVSSSIRTSMYFTYPTDMMDLLINGNASFVDAEKTIDMSKFQVNGSVWAEDAFGFQRNLTSKINVGLRVKLLQGLANINTAKSDISLTTNPSNYYWSVKSNFTLNMASIYDTNSEYSVSKILQNRGFAIDVGGEYKINENILVGASLLDFGYINWKSNTKQYSTTMRDDEFVFKGLDLSNYFSNDSTNGNFVDELLDTLKNQFQFNDSLKQDYKTGIYPKLCASVYYKLGENNKFGFFTRNDFANGTIFPSITLSYNRKFGRILELGVSYSMINNSWANIGAGMAIKLGPFQTYLSSENLLTVFKPTSGKNVFFHFGINFVFGKYSDTPVFEVVE